MKKSLFLLLVALMATTVSVNAQKRKTQRRQTAAKTVTYPQRDADFLPNYRLQSTGSFSLYDDNRQYVTLAAPDFKGHVLQRNMNRKQIRLRQLSCRENDITDEEYWFERNNLSPIFSVYKNEPTPQVRPRLRVDTDGYSVVTYGPYWVEATKLAVCDTELKNVYKAYDFSVAVMPPGINEVCGLGGVDHVMIEGNIMYVSHQTYSDYKKGDMGRGGYLSAIDMRTDEIIWTTKTKTSNCHFEIVGNSIICGYGNSFERDFLYVVDKFSGQRVQTIPLKKAASYIIEKDSKVYVRTYSFDYVFTY